MNTEEIQELPRNALMPGLSPSRELLDGGELADALYELAEEVREKIVARQYGVPTFCDTAFLQFVEQMRQAQAAGPWEVIMEGLGAAEYRQMRAGLDRLRGLLARRAQGRFVSYHERPRVAAADAPHSEIGPFELAMSQGVRECMNWKGEPLFKTVYDFSIYSMMLWELKPRTVIELGSGAGVGAVWMADLLKLFGLGGHVYSVDLNRPDVSHDGVTFIEGDCYAIEKVFPPEMLAALPHPWLVIEDAHVNVYGVLSHFHPHLHRGDYVVVEDSGFKHDFIRMFLQRHPEDYKLDTHYLDFFGRNATCSIDSMLVRT